MALNTITPLTEYAFKVASIDRLIVKPGEIPVPDKEAITVTFDYVPVDSLADQNYEFIQTEELTEAGIAVQPYGAVLVNMLAPSQVSGLYLKLKTAGGVLVSDTDISDILDGGAGTSVTFAAESEGDGGGDDSGDDPSDNT